MFHYVRLRVTEKERRLLKNIANSFFVAVFLAVMFFCNLVLWFVSPVIALIIDGIIIFLLAWYVLYRAIYP